jgi:hypothetical protein
MLKPITAKIPEPNLPIESARSITVIEAGQGIIPPAAPKARICPKVGRSPRFAYSGIVAA